MRRQLSIIATAVLATPLTAAAVPVLFDFVGTGYVCTFDARDLPCDPQDTRAFTGFVSIDVLAAGPSGDDGGSSPETGFAWDFNGWVESHFLIQWDSNTFETNPLPGETGSNFYTQVNNNPFYDQLTNQALSEVNVSATEYRYRYAVLERSTPDTSWLRDLSFPITGLAPGTAFDSNKIGFGDVTRRGNESSSFYGDVGLTSLTRRDTSVPAPGALGLFVLALGGCALVRRRKSA